ncbi:hypothetical protein MJO52_15380 [Microbulbifer variabilis]|uniref:Uncharacterized protein n=1 Tax=Microbulbifer variabilis TaxID=266805 RepID=A0ABY4V849_9GAMM|nr:hypothetical protein [Microbulbifer variabilis]USD20446.1 hypothetical protein MJO52_15380 [Microbulbifer variabilis]
MNMIGKYTVLVVTMVSVMLCSSLYFRPPGLFDLPRYLDIFLNIKSYFAQGLLSGMVGLVLAKKLGISKYAVFTLGLAISVVLLALNSLRIQSMDFYHAQFVALPLIGGIAGGITIAEYVQHLTSLGTRRLRRWC